MSLNFYGRIREWKDGTKNISISITTDSLSDKQVIALKKLKAAGVVNLVAEDATLTFSEPVDIETGKPLWRYYMTNDGWKREKEEQTALELDGENNYRDAEAQITTDVIDKFIMTQDFEYKNKVRVKHFLNKLQDGLTFEDIAKDDNTTVVAVIQQLQKAREYVAPFAAAWKALMSDD
jgi:hypothetical protein